MANNLSCTRGERTLFSKVCLKIQAGEWLHLRGANGTGKTSLLKLLTGLVLPAAGEISWREQVISENALLYRQEMLFLGHQSAIKEDLTALENLQFMAGLDGFHLSDEKALLALHRLGLQRREDLPVRVLSAGQKRRVLLARLLTRPAKLWLLDEPLTALDTNASDIFCALVLEHLNQGGLAVLTSHTALSIPNGKVLQL